MQYNVRIDAFEGPLDLLLHLINTYEIDIYDIPVSEITDQYLKFIQTMKVLQLDIASEYLVMAATLLAIKSKMLLPKQEEQLFDDELDAYEGEDPREELVQRLIEYRKYKEAAYLLRDREAERSLTFTKPPSDLRDLEAEEDQEIMNPIGSLSIYDMLSAFQKLLKRQIANKPFHTKIERQEIPISQRMDEILSELRLSSGRRSFGQLFPNSRRDYIVVTFLAILELMKSNEIVCQQDGNFHEILIIYQGDIIE